MDPLRSVEDDSNHETPLLDWRWWSSSVPILPSEEAISHSHQFFETSTPAFQTSTSDTYVLNDTDRNTYYASPASAEWPHEPIIRSMSANAVSNSGEPGLKLHNNTSAPRQIRFVSTDHGQPHTKRRRILAACLTCRRRKTRCSGERPVCKTCSDNGHNCTGYSEIARHKSSGQESASDHGEDSSSSSPHKRPASARNNGRRPETTPLQPAKALAALRTGSASDSAASVQSAQSGHSASRVDGVDTRSPGSIYTTASMASAHNRVPYFRYFGPTAIVPGFKQMVVQMKDHRRSTNSVAGDSPASAAIGMTPSVAGQDRPTIDIPFYDATDPTPNAPIITELCETFFSYLGCNYSFLQRERFLRDLEDKRVDAILVDAVCAVAARFSSHQMLSIPTDQSVPVDSDGRVKIPFRGHPFAQRAQAAVIDTFPCPTIAVAQACLLLAYEEYGTDHDSGLWMYLGTSIRMAQDLGIQKLEGLQLAGRIGPTPKTAKNGNAGKEQEKRRAENQTKLSRTHQNADPNLLDDRRASESERIDTFYCIFFLDRAVSSGVGRPVTLRDKDIEISFPYIADDQAINGWPHPFPPMIRIVHMYGRVADVLNNIMEVSQVTPEVLKRLAGMEKDLTGIYQGLSPKLHFNATNFQHYVKADQGTNFILLHFWFHTLIVLLHQPTLLRSFEGRIQQLFPDSRELSMSSAKTIADILAFAELIDVNSFIGNPFTSQPMYVAACAFLAEAALHASRPPSRSTTPPRGGASRKPKFESGEDIKARLDKKQSSKHTLLAAAANQNYQRCYKALKLLCSYWQGCRYVLTALDQKAKGLMDPLLFTQDDLDGEMPSTEPSFTAPGWRRSIWTSASMGGPVGTGALSRLRALGSSPNAPLWSPKLDHSQAIGWSLTGTTNSPAPNLSFLYQAANSGKPEDTPAVTEDVTGRREQNLGPPHSLTLSETVPQSTHYANAGSMLPPPPRNHFSPQSPTTDAELMMNMNAPYTSSSAHPLTTSPHSSLPPGLHHTTSNTAPSSHSHFDYSHRANTMQSYFPPNHPHQGTFHHPTSGSMNGTNYSSPNLGDLFIESQDVDMSESQGGFGFPGSDMIPWLEYLPQDVLNYFADNPTDEHAVAGVMPGGPGPSQGEGH